MDAVWEPPPIGSTEFGAGRAGSSVSAAVRLVLRGRTQIVVAVDGSGSAASAGGKPGPSDTSQRE